jgi:enoyl-CoA hydratase/3-hydroxyacyl-CoA dehydrogenase
MFVFKAAVLGGGTMGGEIAQVIAAADIPVVVKDIDKKFVDAAIEKSRQVTKSQLDRLVSKEKLTQEQADARLEEVMGLIGGTTTYDGFGDVDIVIEAVPEKLELKRAVYAELDRVTPGHAILASNTSSLSVSEMGRATLRPEKVVGFHFFYPASVMPLVEVISGEDTSRETVTAAFNFAQAIRKQPITCREVPGFVVNRILNSAVGEIWRRQEEGGLSIKKIDDGVAEANVAPMGPFVLGDMLGLDTILHVAEHLQESYGERFYVHKGMRKLVKAGKLGTKSGGEGFYADGEPTIEGDADPDGAELADLFVLKSLVEACALLEERVSTVREIDLGMMAGAGLDPRRGLFPPFWKADLEGLDTTLEKLERYQESHGERFAPPPTLKRLVAQGRLGLKSGHGFYAYPQGEGEGPDERDLTRRDLRPGQGLGAGQGRRRGQGDGRLLLAAGGLLGGRRHQGVHEDGQPGEGRRADRQRPRAAEGARGEPRVHGRGGERDRLRRRLRAGDGLRLPGGRPLRRLRPARDQPRDHPRLRRHPAAAATGRPLDGEGDEPDRGRGAGPGGAGPGARRRGGAR